MVTGAPLVSIISKQIYPKASPGLKILLCLEHIRWKRWMHLQKGSTKRQPPKTTKIPKLRCADRNPFGSSVNLAPFQTRTSEQASLLAIPSSHPSMTCWTPSWNLQNKSFAATNRELSPWVSSNAEGFFSIRPFHVRVEPLHRVQ